MFRTGAYKTELSTLIENDQLCIHSFLVAELALGTLPERAKTLAFLDRLIQLRPVRLTDVRHMIETTHPHCRRPRECVWNVMVDAPRRSMSLPDAFALLRVVGAPPRLVLHARLGGEAG